MNLIDMMKNRQKLKKSLKKIIKKKKEKYLLKMKKKKKIINIFFKGYHLRDLLTLKFSLKQEKIGKQSMIFLILKKMVRNELKQCFMQML
jgi:hypothetical protein